jgi:hypothetical protein
MNRFMAALAQGLAVKHTARGAQSQLPTAGQRPPFLTVDLESPADPTIKPPALHRLRGICSNPPTPSGSAPPPTTDGVFSQPVRVAAVI